MFRKKRKLDPKYDALIEKAVNALNVHPIGSEEYVKTLDMIDRLEELKGHSTQKPLSRDTMAVVGANLLGILMIIKNEQLHVITSKALSFIIKAKV